MSERAGEILLEELPESLAAIAQAIGLPATLKIMQRYGGARTYVPHPEHLTAEHPLVRLIGLEPARKFAEIYRTNKIEIPRAAEALRRARDRVIRSEWPAKSQARLALEYGMTERQIRNILNDADDIAVAQPRLF